MDEPTPAPEQLIASMSPAELVELLEELGIESDETQAQLIQQLVVQLGAFEAAIESLTLLERMNGRSAA